MPTTTAAAAPAFRPRMPGSASGLRVMPCIAAPAVAKEAPTAMPATVRSSRAWITAWSVTSWSKWARACQTVSGPTLRAPTSSERAPAATRARTPPVRTGRGARAISALRGLDRVEHRGHHVLDRPGQGQGAGGRDRQGLMVIGRQHQRPGGHGGDLGEQGVVLEVLDGVAGRGPGVEDVHVQL